jgi:hypothetical protein
MTAVRRRRGTGRVRNKGTEREPRWQAGYSVTVDGRRREVTRSFGADEAAARAWLEQAISTAHAADAFTSTDPQLTIHEALDRYYTRKAAVGHRCTPRTLRNHRTLIDRHLTPHIGHLRVIALSITHVQQLMRALASPGANGRHYRIGGIDGQRHQRPDAPPLSVKTRQHVYSVLHQTLTWAVREQIVEHNVCHRLDPGIIADPWGTDPIRHPPANRR